MSAREIWKYPLIPGPRAMPRGALPLCVQMQDETPCMWALVDPDAPMETREFLTVGTGHRFDPHGCLYVGTWQDGALVFHLWEKNGGAS